MRNECMRKAFKWFAGAVGTVVLLSAAFGIGAVKTNAAGEIAVDSTNFPDENFGNFVGIHYDTNQDFKLSSTEIAAVTTMDCSYCEIKSLKGIEYFTNLKTLNCSHNELTALNVSKNTKLEALDCVENKIKSLNVNSNKKLAEMYCSNNALTSVKLDTCPSLVILELGGNNLTELKIGSKPYLEVLSFDCNGIKEIDVTGCPALISLYCGDNKIRTLDLSKNTKLEDLWCADNKLTALDISNNTKLRRLACYGTTYPEYCIKTLDISKHKSLLKAFKLGTYDRSAEGFGQAYAYSEEIEGYNEFFIVAYSLNTELITGLPNEVDFSLSRSAGNVILSWDAIARAKTYVILRKEEGEKNYTVIGTTDKTTYKDKDAVRGKTYIYTVRIKDLEGHYYGTYNKAGKKITVPVKVSAKPVVNPGNIRVSWKAVSGADKYRIFRKTGDGSWTKLATVTELKYFDKNVVYGKEYSYAVVAMSAKGSYISETDYSQIESKVQYLLPAVNIKLSVAKKGAYIKWETVDGAQKYRIFRKNSKGEWAKITTVKSGNTYIDTAVSDGHTYTYTVVGMDASGRLMNAYGDGSSIQWTAPVLNFTLKSTAKGVKITWDKFSGAASYIIVKKDDDFFGDIAEVHSGNSLEYVDTTVVNGNTYEYYVVAMDEEGNCISKSGVSKTIKYVKPVSEAEMMEVSTDDLIGILVTTADEEEVIAEDAEEEIAEEEISEDDEDAVAEEEIAEDEASEDVEEAEENEEEIVEEEVSENDEDAVEEIAEEKISEDGEDEEEVVEETSEEEIAEGDIAEEEISEEGEDAVEAADEIAREEASEDVVEDEEVFEDGEESAGVDEISEE